MVQLIVQCCVLSQGLEASNLQVLAPLEASWGLFVPLHRWHQAQQPPSPQAPFALTMGSGSGSGRQGEGLRGGPESYF